MAHQQVCPLCNSWMQHQADPKNPLDLNKYLKCSCGFSKLAKEEHLPEIPSDEEIEEKLKKIEEETLKEDKDGDHSKRLDHE